jgi:hypothetical protein
MIETSIVSFHLIYPRIASTYHNGSVTYAGVSGPTAAAVVPLVSPSTTYIAFEKLRQKLTGQGSGNLAI